MFCFFLFKQNPPIIIKSSLNRSVEEEIRQNVRRIQSHPSIALWAGNNENEAALRSNW